MQRAAPTVLALLPVTAWLLPPAAGLAQTAAAVGAELQVNTYTTNAQRNPAVASDAEGNFVVVWDSYGSSGGDTSSFSVQAQRYDASGVPLGAQFQVNTYTTSTQSIPAVASDPDGNFVVVWGSDGSSGGDTLGFSVQAQRYDAAGTPLGAQFQVNTYTTSTQSIPAVASDRNGDFVVVWQSFGSSGGDISNFSVQAQRYDAAGIPLGAQFQVNTYTTGTQSYALLASDRNGNFVVVWHSFGSSGSDSSDVSVQAQRYDAAGIPLGAEFQVNTYTTSSQSRPAVASNPDGDFVVVWHSFGSSGGDISSFSVQAQRYDAAGNPLGAQFQVNTYTTDNQSFPAVASDTEGDFVVVWHSTGSSGGDTSGTSVQAQLYEAARDPLGAQFQVNTYTTSDQLGAAVASDPDGDFVVVWQSYASSGGDTDSSSVQAQRYRVTGDLGDRVFFDLDFDGIQDGGEPGIMDVAVHLFDPFATLVRSTTTDATGLYRLQPKPGEYYLQFELPSIYAFTPQDRGGDDSLDSDAEVFTGETDTFSVALLSNDLDWDAGMSNGIGDRVWLDADGNGVQSGGESGLAGVSVELFTELGAPVDATTTDGDGRYSFPGMQPGVYYLQFNPPAGAAFTLQDAVIDERVDSDVFPLTGTTIPFAFAPGDLDVTWDAGIVTSVTVGDRVWLDDNGNGIQDGNENGSSGVTVHLRQAVTHTLVGTETSDANGFFGFTAAPDTYYLEVLLPSGFAFTPRDQGTSDGADSDVEPTTGTTIAFTLGAGGPDLTRDAGLEPAVLGNQVWLDDNGNGLQDAGERGVAGILVRLLDGIGAELQTATTDASGRYAFAGLPTGNYELEFAPPSGYGFTIPNQGTDSRRDSDADASTGRTGLIPYTAATAARSFDAGLLEIPIFADGFESASTAAWAAAVP